MRSVITERKRTELELIAARAEAERANQAKDEFVAMLPHELRNPLAPMLTALQLLARGADAPERAPGGLGLGLAIVRNFVITHGGVVRAESGGPNQGSEFIIELPAVDLTLAEGAVNG